MIFVSLIQSYFLIPIIFLFSLLISIFYTYKKYQAYKSLTLIDEEPTYIYKQKKDNYKSMSWVLRIGELVFISLLVYIVWISGFDYLGYHILLVLVLSTFIIPIEIVIKENKIAINFAKIILYNSGLYILGDGYYSWDQLSDIKLKRKRNEKQDNVILFKTKGHNNIQVVDDKTLEIIKKKVKGN